LQVTSIFILFRYFLWSLFFFLIYRYQFLHYLVSLVFYVQLWTHRNDLFLCRCVVAQQLFTMPGDVSQVHGFKSHLKQFFSFNNFFNTQTLNFKISINWWARDAWWYIKDTWIGFSTRNITKQAVAPYTFMASWTMGCLKWRNYCLSLMNTLENKTFNRSQRWSIIY